LPPVNTSAESSIRQLVAWLSAVRRSSSARARSGGHWRDDIFARDDRDGVCRDDELRLDAVAPQVDLGSAVLPDIEDWNLFRSAHRVGVEPQFAAEGKRLRGRIRRQAQKNRTADRRNGNATTPPTSYPT